MTPEIQQLKEDIAILQMKLQKLEEAEKQQPKTLLDAIRNLGYSVDSCYEIIDAVEDFYETVDDELQERGEKVHKEAEKLVNKIYDGYEFHPIPQSPEEVDAGLKEAFKQAQQTEEWKKLQELIDEEDNDKNFKNSLDLIKEWGEKNKPPTLYEILWEWWEDIFTRNSDLDADASIDILVDRIAKEFIPPSSSTNTYDWERCLKMMRGKLR
jgi:hypothetical protein